MATIGYFEPRRVGNSTIREPFITAVNLAQNAAVRRGDIVVEATTGTILLPPGAGTGTGAGIAGPAGTVITLGTSASAGAPAATYFGQVTYNLTNHTNESLPSALFVQNVPAGFLPTVSVAAAGAPFSATNFQVYMGLLPDFLSVQTVTAGVALGGTFTAANPLTNYAGAARGATNLTGAILGIALHDSLERYFSGYGGSFTANPDTLLGATNQLPPLSPEEAPLLYIATFGRGEIWEFNLNTASGGFSPFMINTTAGQVGLTLDATTGWFTVDTTQSNKVAQIVGYRPGVYIGPTAGGNPGDLGVRVQVQFLSTALAIN